MKFCAQVALWTGILMAVLASVSLITGTGVAVVVSHLAGWAGLALVLAAFPAGLALSQNVVPSGRVTWQPIGQVIAAVMLVAAFTFVLAGWVGPAAVRWLNPDVTPVTVADEPGRLSLPELRREMNAAIQAARATGGEPTVSTWLPANRLAWHYYSRQDGSLVLPFLFAGVGIFMGFWTRQVARADVRQLQHWAMGLFLVVTTYLMGENSYELIVLRAAGLVDFAADVRLVIPASLFVGFGWPTVVTLWNGNATSS